MDCCKKTPCYSTKTGIMRGIVYGLIPHCGCILFILFAVLGVTTVSSFFRPFLTNTSFFYGLIALSFVFATISAIFYLRKQQSLSWQGIQKNWKYLLILYGTVIIVNIILLKIIFPNITNLFSSAADVMGVDVTELTLEVDIPCSGHAFLVIGDLKEVDGVLDVNYRSPNLFDISYSSNRTSQETILGVEIFEEFEGNIVSK